MKYQGGGYGRRFAYRGRFMPQQAAPVNIQEMDDRYEIYLIAPGRKREDFRLDVADDLLTIHVKAPVADQKGEWQRKEFRFHAFQRSFQLSDKINEEEIRAAYHDGMLIITLPKHPDQVTQRREVTVE